MHLSPTCTHRAHVTGHLGRQCGARTNTGSVRHGHTHSHAQVHSHSHSHSHSHRAHRRSRMRAAACGCGMSWMHLHAPSRGPMECYEPRASKNVFCSCCWPIKPVRVQFFRLQVQTIRRPVLKTRKSRTVRLFLTVTWKSELGNQFYYMPRSVKPVKWPVADGREEKVVFLREFF